MVTINESFWSEDQLGINKKRWKQKKRSVGLRPAARAEDHSRQWLDEKADDKETYV